MNPLILSTSSNASSVSPMKHLCNTSNFVAPMKHLEFMCFMGATPLVLFHRCNASSFVSWVKQNEFVFINMQAKGLLL